ncbi:MAG: hypothetical protein M2R45_02614 [Verrucomicrobia subdivision 3 bacterium]|nr:hypothetical protein [Limisphaerales bacterium]MCS1416418.1 hypothetical protein [Limisphaerales bacterium]
MNKRELFNASLKCTANDPVWLRLQSLCRERDRRKNKAQQKSAIAMNTNGITRNKARFADFLASLFQGIGRTTIIGAVVFGLTLTAFTSPNAEAQTDVDVEQKCWDDYVARNLKITADHEAQENRLSDKARKEYEESARIGERELKKEYERHVGVLKNINKVTMWLESYQHLHPDDADVIAAAWAFLRKWKNDEDKEHNAALEAIMDRWDKRNDAIIAKYRALFKANDSNRDRRMTVSWQQYLNCSRIY